MNQKRFALSRGLTIRIALAATIVTALASVIVFDSGSNLVAKVSSMSDERQPNNLPHPNPGGKAATFSTQGEVNLTGEYFQAQGTNGRSCVSCHIPDEAWSINPGTLQDLFDQTGGTQLIGETGWYCRGNLILL